MNPTPGSLDNITYFPLQFDQFVQSINQELVAVTRRHGYSRVSQAQLVVLGQFQDGMSNSDLVHRLGTSKQAVSLLIKQLSQQGYLVAQPCAADHRRTQLYLTQRGIVLRHVIANWYRQLHEWIKLQLGELTFDKLCQDIPALMKAIKQL